MTQAAKLKWMCRRGMKELDVMLSAYLERCYPLADDEEQAVFEQLLTMQDPVLHALLMHHIQSEETDTDRLIEKIRDAAKV